MRRRVHGPDCVCVVCIDAHANPAGPKRSVIVCGIDTGLAHMGVAFVSARSGDVLAADVYETKPDKRKREVLSSDDIVRRGTDVAMRLGLAFRMWEPAVVGAEAISYPRNSSAALKIGIAFGLVIGECSRARIPLPQFSPQRVREKIGLRRMVDGKRAAVSKADVELQMAKLYPGARKMIEQIEINAGDREHAWDALAAAHACRDTDLVRALLRV